jgi:uncharacterized protein
MTTPAVDHLPEKHRFEVTVDGRGGHLAYSVQDRVMTIAHTEVDPALEGRGLAGALVKAALEHARAHGLRVDPVCPFAASYMQRHPESLSLRV